MNKIYKVIWSKAKNCYVVVSEIAKRNSKRSSGVVGSVVRSALAGAVFVACLGYTNAAMMASAAFDSGGYFGGYYVIDDGNKSKSDNPDTPIYNQADKLIKKLQDL